MIATERLQPDARVFGFMIAAAVVSALLFGLAPAIQGTRLNVMQAARGEFTTDYCPARLHNALVDQNRKAGPKLTSN